MFLRTLFVTMLAVAGIASSAVLAHAAAPIAGDIIKLATKSDVYYVGTDGKRYVFPNEKTYASWYTGFDATKTVTDEELAALSVGGAATYRPGVRMVKLTTDPKVYAVAKGGTLRWVQTETLATQLYGQDWAKKIDDLPDAYFATYKLGSPIASTADYSPSAETAATTSISVDKSLAGSTSTSTPPIPSPTPTSTTSGTLSLAVSKLSVSGGDSEELNAVASHPTGIIKISLYFDGALITNCYKQQCVGEVIVAHSDKTSLIAKAVATALNGDTLTKEVIVTVNGTVSNLVTLAIGRATIRSGQSADAIITINTAISPIRTDIYRNGINIKSCVSSIQECRWSGSLSGTVGTIYTFYGKVTNAAGRVYESVRKTVTIATNDEPVVSLNADNGTLYKNETTKITATASDDDGIASIELKKDGQTLKTCQGIATCSVSVGPWQTAGQESYTAVATDLLGATSTAAVTTLTLK